MRGVAVESLTKQDLRMCVVCVWTRERERERELNMECMHECLMCMCASRCNGVCGYVHTMAKLDYPLLLCSGPSVSVNCE